MEETFKQLSKILTLTPLQLSNYTCIFQGHPEQHLQKFLLAYQAKEDLQNQSNAINRFINYMSDLRNCKLFPEYFGTYEGMKILSCNQAKSYFFEHQARGYCIYGRAVSCLRRKTKQIETERNYLCSQIENTIFQLHQEGNYPLTKNESHDIDDILLTFSNEDPTLDPIYLSNEVFSPFIPQPYALILVLPIPLPRPDYLMNFLKGTLLHIYMEQVNLLSKIIFREVFYNNSHVKGIYFIEEGEVESTGGRIVARGWVTNGKCKSEGYGWKFKLLPFLKSIAKNEHIWKQFLNDLTSNKEYPFKISYLLGREEDFQYQAPDKKGKRGIKLPRIGHSSFDYGKLTQIEKVKHYDDRISEICDFKEKLLQKKSGNYMNRNAANLLESYDEKSHRNFLLRHPSNSKAMLRYPSTNLASSSENILIMSVLKKLQSLAEPRAFIQQQYKERREKLKISPAKLFQKSRVMKKKRYNQ